MTLDVAIINDLKQFATELEQDAELRKQANTILAEKCNPYVPYQTGRLAHNITIDEDGITYNQPYASNVYESAGEHSQEVHPLASSYWDEVAVQNHGEEIEAEVAELVQKRAEELSGNG